MKMTMMIKMKKFRTTVRIARALALGVFCCLAAARVQAAVHPVPLDKNVDSKKCLECHDDKGKGKHVHSAMESGCLTCHEVRTNKDVTHIKLVSPTVVGLCTTCHEDKKAMNIKGTVHPPAVRDCLTCHDPHASDNKNQLKKPTQGDVKENLCLSCHTQGTNVPEKGSRHLALDMGCDTCHTTHKTGAEPTEENKFHLTKSAPALCLDCHDAKDASLQKAHKNQPFATAKCTECHDPHQSAQQHLLAKYTHPPFADKSCELCHADPKDGKVVLTETDTKKLCGTCHDEKPKMIETSKVMHPGAAGECTDCHSPHASRERGLPKTNGVEICTTCHSDVADEGKKPVHHQPAFGQACATCHTPHGGDIDHLLRASGNNLCLECHGPDTLPQHDTAKHEFKIFNGSVTLPDDYYQKNKVVILPLRYGLGHPVDNHPVSNVPDPADKNKVKTHLSCLSCHQPHSSMHDDLLVKDQQNNMAFCDNCHKNRVNMTETVEPAK